MYAHIAGKGVAVYIARGETRKGNLHPMPDFPDRTSKFRKFQRLHTPKIHTPNIWIIILTTFDKNNREFT